MPLYPHSCAPVVWELVKEACGRAITRLDHKGVGNGSLLRKCGVSRVEIFRLSTNKVFTGVFKMRYLSALLGCVLLSVAVFLPLHGLRAQAYISEGRLVIPLRGQDDGGRPDPSIMLPGSVSVDVLRDASGGMALSEAVLEDFGAYLVELAVESGLPGVAMAVVRDTDFVWTGFTGVRTLGREGVVDEETLFNLGPATQALTSMLAAILTEQDPLLLDRPARRISAGFRMSDPQAGERVRLRDLLDMTAGLPTYTDATLDPAWARPEDVLALMAQAPVVAQPGRLHSRSWVSAAAGGYLLGQIAMPGEDLYQAFAQSISERFLLPAGMTATVFSHRKAVESGKYASPHQKEEDGAFRPARSWESDPNAFAPALGAKMNILDAIRWLQLEIAAGSLVNGVQLAPADAVRSRWLPEKAGQAGSFSMGWSRRHFKGIEMRVAVGSYDRHSAIIGLFPVHRMGFAVFVNADASVSNRIFEEMALGLAEMLAEVPWQANQ